MNLAAIPDSVAHERSMDSRWVSCDRNASEAATWLETRLARFCAGQFTFQPIFSFRKDKTIVGPYAFSFLDQ
jgi:hypothetical protein